MTRLPLGEKESQRLELKGRDALKDRHRIGREVVAMLNAEGGEVWVGLAEEDGRAVKVEPIENAETERRMLRDFLVDSIEPSPGHSEVEVHAEDADQRGQVLRVEVRPTVERKPYALLKQGGRWYVTRVGDRLRPMTRDEVFGAAEGENRRNEELQVTIRKVIELRKKVLESPEPTFWLHLAPSPPLQIDLHAPTLREIAVEPTITKNRNAGWTFVRATEEPHLTKGRLSWRTAYRRETEIKEDGSLTCRAPLASLYWKGDDPKEIWPLVLLELPISAFRVASVLYEEYRRSGGSGGHVIADLVLRGLQGWRLRGGSPRSLLWFGGTNEYQDAIDLTWEDPLVFSLEEVIDEHDRCGFRLVRRVYEAFGFYEDAIPQEFDRKTGRLVLPE